MSAGANLTFHCPDCGEAMTVNESMRDALLDHGCVVCGTTLSSSAFSHDDC
jgi:predicted RNA-binding Zn-ribbon protein involved in translation (DUF1610 family)